MIAKIIALNEIATNQTRLKISKNAAFIQDKRSN